jgi:hypothetical protein
VSFDAYRSIDAINWSSLKHLWAGSPLHYQHHLANPDSDTTARMSGRLLHTLALGDAGDEAFVIYEGGDRRGKAWIDFQAEHAGKTILKPSEAAPVLAQVAAVHKHREAQWALRGAVEETLLWTDPDTGLKCKARLDVLNLTERRIADLKGCGSLALLDRQCHRLGYVHQLAHYRRGVRVAHSVDVSAYMVGVETKPPHDVGVWRVDRDLLDLAERDVVAALTRLARCIETDEWPGLMPDISDMFTPTWMLSDELDIPDAGLDEVSDERF